MIELRYDPLFAPGDILAIRGYAQPGMVTGTKLCGAVDEILAGRRHRICQILFWMDGRFQYGEFSEIRLEEDAERVDHIDYGEMTYDGRDVAEVLAENRQMKDLVNKMLLRMGGEVG